jgi:hypothetical protein
MEIYNVKHSSYNGMRRPANFEDVIEETNKEDERG